MTTPMSPERFQDRFEAYKGEPQQVSGVWRLFEAIRKADEGILTEEADWATKFSEAVPPQSGDAPENKAAPAFSETRFDPHGSEEAGMIGPKKMPIMGPHDTYLLVNDRDEDMEAYDCNTKLLWRVPCLARGQGGDRQWRAPRTDTPPGLYKLGQLYDDRTSGNTPPAYNRTHLAYGWMTYDMVDLEGNEDGSGRAGICVHGGGSGCGWPGAWAPKQHLLPTFGCVRVHNSVLSDLIYPRYKMGTVYVGVWQEA